MGSQVDEWNAVARSLAELPAPERLRSRLLGRLYELALGVAPKLLRALKIDTDTACSIALELLISKVDQIVESRVPYPFFVTSLKNRAKDWLRNKGARVADAQAVEQSVDTREQLEARLAVRAIEPRLRDEEWEIFNALNLGEDRNAIALALKTTRANVDQIISRARKRLREEGFE